MKREAVFQRDGFQCVYCGTVGEADELSVDHVEPKMRGGDNSAGNQVTACLPCNGEKGGQAAWRYLASRREKREHFLQAAPYVWPRLRRAILEAAH
jgi:5-methylcytosine-specific restriction endonuclease McrA